MDESTTTNTTRILSTLAHVLIPCPRCPCFGGPWPPFDPRASRLLDLALMTTEALSTATEALSTLTHVLEEESLP